jgi:hypothetical protein
VLRIGLEHVSEDVRRIVIEDDADSPIQQ